MKKIEFLNIDLDLESTDDLSPIISEFSNSVIVLNQEKENNLNKVSFELSGATGNPDYLFKHYISIINNLSSNSKKLWYGCSKREFDLGFESGDTPRDVHNNISSTIINALSKLEASVTITIYSI